MLSVQISHWHKIKAWGELITLCYKYQLNTHPHRASCCMCTYGLPTCLQE